MPIDGLRVAPRCQVPPPHSLTLPAPSPHSPSRTEALLPFILGLRCDQVTLPGAVERFFRGFSARLGAIALARRNPKKKKKKFELMEEVEVTEPEEELEREQSIHDMLKSGFSDLFHAKRDDIAQTKPKELEDFDSPIQSRGLGQSESSKYEELQVMSPVSDTEKASSAEEVLDENQASLGSGAGGAGAVPMGSRTLGLPRQIRIGSSETRQIWCLPQIPVVPRQARCH